MVRCGSKNGYQKIYVFKIDWTMCSKYNIHSRLDSQHNRGGVYDNDIECEIPTSSKNQEESGYDGFELELLPISDR